MDDSPKDRKTAGLPSYVLIIKTKTQRLLS
jgi:hypothetical protein